VSILCKEKLDYNKYDIVTNSPDNFRLTVMAL